MDDVFDAQLRAQELALHHALLLLEGTMTRLPCVLPDREWVGPASSMYQAAVDGLRSEMATAQERLQAALHYTRQAMATRARP